MSLFSVVPFAAAATLTCLSAFSQERYPADYEPPAAPEATVRPPAPVASAPLHPLRPRARGSLYADATYNALTSDRRRFQVGDILTILIAENASASSTADTGTGRDSNVGLNITTPLTTKGAGLAANNDYTGSGRTQRAGRVLAQISVTVREVLPNGDLAVAGDQQLEINGEKQLIRAEGRVRPRDVTEQNVVPSSRMAEAKLAFLGDGVLGDQQKPRWWQKLLGLFGI